MTTSASTPRRIATRNQKDGVDTVAGCPSVYPSEVGHAHLIRALERFYRLGVPQQLELRVGIAARPREAGPGHVARGHPGH